ncbi:MAG: hypothetical protein M1816_000416 [Peltula sp. TS41687]|nr:MAG: hypothetical protein M1816_000416 [Peltula sp. TS41687]
MISWQILSRLQPDEGFPIRGTLMPQQDPKVAICHMPLSLLRLAYSSDWERKGNKQFQALITRGSRQWPMPHCERSRTKEVGPAQLPLVDVQEDDLVIDDYSSLSQRGPGARIEPTPEYIERLKELVHPVDVLKKHGYSLCRTAMMQPRTGAKEEV